MKTTKQLLICLSIFLLLSGCSSPKDSNESKLEQSVNQITEIPADLDADNSAITVESNTDAKKPSTVTPTPKKEVVTEVNPEANKKNASELVGYRWNLYELEAKYIEPSTSLPFIYFEEDGRVSGFSGCNNYSGTYTLENPNNLTFSPLAATLKYCEESAEIEAIFMKVLSTIKSYTVSKDGGILYLNDGDPRTVATFIQQ